MNEVCPLCTHNHLLPVQGINSPVYFFCSNCELIFMEDAYIPDAEKEKARYDAHHNSIDNSGYVKWLEAFIERAILPFSANVQSILDFGSGPGPVLSLLLKERGFMVDLYDPYYAPEKVFLGRRYDLVTCTETLEHIRDPRSTFELFADLLVTGGKLAIMTLFHPGTLDFQKWWYRRDFTHIRFFNQQTFHWICDHYPFQLLMSDSRNTIVLERL